MNGLRHALCLFCFALVAPGFYSCSSAQEEPPVQQDAQTDQPVEPDVAGDTPTTADAVDDQTDAILDSEDLLTDGDVGPVDVCDEDHPDWTVGLLHCTPDAYVGYTLFAPSRLNVTYLIDIHGRLVHSWDSQYRPGLAVYLLENGNLLHTGNMSEGFGDPFRGGGIGGLVEEIAWDGTVLWSFQYSNEEHWQHHDVERLPNGNTLLVAWESFTAAEAEAAGRAGRLLRGDDFWPDHIVEIEPDGTTGGTIVWEWHAMDHVIQDEDEEFANFGVVADHPELIDINYPARREQDWLHVNSVDYSESFDQIILSVHNFSEIWVIDHSTTTAEAASHSGGNSGMGGDLLYRWGNPQAYRAGLSEDQWLFGQHDAQWIVDGLPGAENILVFNNGIGRLDGQYSNVIEITPAVDEFGQYEFIEGSYGPSEPTWIYAATPVELLFSEAISGANRLPNGNTLICEGNSGTFHEVTAEGEIVWQYVNPAAQGGRVTQGEEVPTQGNNPTNNVFRAYRYGPDYPGLSGRELEPGDYIEWPAE